MRGSQLLVPGGLLVLLLAACSEGDAPVVENTADAEQNIVGGTADTTNQAVVAWLHGSKCSATIIDVSGSTGYALTAAHCVGGGLGNLYQGNDHDNPVRTYPVTSATVHPGYATSSAFDVAILTFSSADGNTPMLPVATKAQDILAVGSTADAIGYGITPGGNSIRRHVQVVVYDSLEVLLGYNQATLGICSGDSGGPSLASGRVVGVHSFTTDTNCTGNNVLGYDVRAAAMLDPFINPEVNGTVPTLHTCDECSEAHRGFGECQGEVSTCIQSVTCDAYITCASNCTTNPCVIGCALTHPAGKAQYDAIFDCVCTQACVAECNGDSSCNEPPQCYLTSSIPACQTCFEASCCSEVANCAADDFCYDCITDIAPGPSCDTDPTVQALQGCLEANCDEECPGGNPAGSGGGGSSGEGGGGVGGALGPGGGMGIGGAGPGGNPAEDDDDFTVVESGCGCRLPDRNPPEHAWWLAALALLGVALHRRRPSA